MSIKRLEFFLLLSKKSTRYWAFATDPAYVYIDPQTSISHSIIHTHASQICRIFPSKLSDFPFFSERAFTLVIGGGQAGAGRRGLINPFLPPPLPLPLPPTPPPPTTPTNRLPPCYPLLGAWKANMGNL